MLRLVSALALMSFSAVVSAQTAATVGTGTSAPQAVAPAPAPVPALAKPTVAPATDSEKASAAQPAAEKPQVAAEAAASAVPAKAATATTGPTASPITRFELYKKITDASGISLKDVFEAIFKKSVEKRQKLNEFAEREGGGRLQKGYAGELEAAKAHCEEDKKTPEQCAVAIEPLKREIAYLADLEKRFLAKPSVTDEQNLAWAMIIFNYVVRHRILEPDMDGWSVACSRGPGSLGGPCQSLRFGLTHVNDLLSELTQASFEAKSTGKTSAEQERRIAAKLAVYEKL